jgi:hypothetical protein
MSVRYDFISKTNFVLETLFCDAENFSGVLNLEG